MTNGRLVKCGKCKKLFYFQAEHKHHKANAIEIIEVGSKCPHCEKWLHLGYLNQELIARQKDITNNRRRRAFKRDYDEWQKKCREMLGIETLAEPAQA